MVEDVADMMGEPRTSLAVEVECSVDSHRLQLPHFVIKLGDCGNDVSRIKPKCFGTPLKLRRGDGSSARN